MINPKMQKQFAVVMFFSYLFLSLIWNLDIIIILSMDGWTGLVNRVFYSTSSTIILITFYLFVHFIIFSCQGDAIQWIKEIRNKKKDAL